MPPSTEGRWSDEAAGQCVSAGSGLPLRRRSKLHPLAQELCRRHEVIPVCGEIFGGLPTPRLPSERREGGVFASDGGDVTDAFCRGAEEVVRLARLTGAQAAILKERSPSWRLRGDL